MSTRKIKCPFCEYRNTKDKIIQHVDSEHDELIPESYSAARVVFNYLNNKDYGICIVCKGKTDWNEKTQKYKRLCNNPTCKQKLRDSYKNNMMKKFGKTTLLDDPEQQQKMLFNRKISGIYRYSDGKIIHYTGSYEKKFIEFLDNVLHIPSSEFIMPGPTIDYYYKGKKHFWILDAYLIEYNCVIDIKDGGDNPNKRTMVEYRNKQIAKEKALSKFGKYNYIRLTNNDFSQLLEFMYEYKNQLKDDSNDNNNIIIKINESNSSIESKCKNAVHEIYNKISLLDSHIKNIKIPGSIIKDKLDKLRKRNKQATSGLVALSYDKSISPNIKYEFNESPKYVYRIRPFYDNDIFWLYDISDYMIMDSNFVISFCKCMSLCNCPMKIDNKCLYMSKKWVNNNKHRKFYIIKTNDYKYDSNKKAYYINIKNNTYNAKVISLGKILSMIMSKINIKFI